MTPGDVIPLNRKPPWLELPSEATQPAPGEVPAVTTDTAKRWPELRRNDGPVPRD